MGAEPDRIDQDERRFMPHRKVVQSGRIGEHDYLATVATPSGNVLIEFDTARTAQDAVYRFELADMVQEAHRKFEDDHAARADAHDDESDDAENGGSDDG